MTIKYLMTHRKKIIEVAYIDEEVSEITDRKRHELLQGDSVCSCVLLRNSSINDFSSKPNYWPII